LNADSAPPTSTDLPFLTADLPGIGGAIKEFPEDFVVEELPRYLPAGDGTHIFFVIEKRGIGTMEAIARLARALGKPPRDFGYAGLKDARGVTRQCLSIEHIDPQRVLDVAVPDVRVLSAARHGNKLKIGHSAGNRFIVRVRGVSAGQRTAADPILAVLQQRGLPNYFGPQRFGARGTNPAVGAAMLRRDWPEAFAILLGRPAANDRDDVHRARELYDAGDVAAAGPAWPHGFALEARACRAVVIEKGPTQQAFNRIDAPTRRLFLSALQSELFNRVLAERLHALDALETGDLAWLHRNGACFAVQDATVEQPRCASFEISPTGPIFGGKMTEPTGAPAEREARILTAAGFEAFPSRAPDGTPLEGARRPLRVPLANLASDYATDEHGPYLELRFDLPPGAYATALTRELCRENPQRG
jgi:tRNA pseudouridine13 synthase